MDFYSDSSLTPSDRRYALIEPSHDPREATTTWAYSLPGADAMDDPASRPVASERAFDMPFMGLQEMVALMYERGDPYKGGDSYEPLQHKMAIDRPLALLDRYQKETSCLSRQVCRNDYYPNPTVSPEEMIRRRWEQALSSRLPAVEKPEIKNGLGQVIPAWVATFPDSSYEDQFLLNLLPQLELLGDAQDHPSEGIRVPRTLAENEYWQEFVLYQAKHFANRLGSRNSWVPFLISRPFVIFQIICDAEWRLRGVTKEIILKSWREQGYWIGTKWSEDCEGPGWTWPCEHPVYFLDDHISSWRLAELWPGDPKAACRRQQQGSQLNAITEEELRDDPTLSKRPKDWERQHGRAKRQAARQELAAASAISIRNCISTPAWISPRKPSKPVKSRKPAKTRNPGLGDILTSAEKKTATPAAEGNRVVESDPDQVSKKMESKETNSNKGKTTTAASNKRKTEEETTPVAGRVGTKQKRTKGANDTKLLVPAREDKHRRSRRLAGCAAEGSLPV